MRRLLISIGLVVASSQIALAQSATLATPTACISSQFTATGSEYWKSITLKLTNNCEKAVDFQNTTITFQSSSTLNTAFWGEFSPLSYPDKALNISSQKQSDGSYLATINLHFPTNYGTTILPVGGSLQILYGSATDSHVDGTTNVYLQSAPAATGTIKLVNQSSQPAGIGQGYAIVHLKFNNQVLNDVQLPWAKTTTLSGLSEGNYSITPENIVDTYGNSYQGTVTPSSIALAKDKTMTSNITYTKVVHQGNITLNLQNLPDNLDGYDASPTILLSQIPSGSSVSKVVAWGETTTMSQLVDGSNYGFSTPSINHNGYRCTATFNPQTLVASTTPATTKITYTCMQVPQTAITLNVSGLPTSLSTLKVTLTPNDHTLPTVQSVQLTEGRGTSSVSLLEGGIYTLQTEAVDGYAASFSPQPLTAAADTVGTITFSKTSETGGRIIGYIPGWKTPPTAQALANAGYTHAMIAFGVFSTTKPGEIVPAFELVTPAYVQSLHQANIKVILSLGGASSSIANTTVNFHDVLAAASSAENFKQMFINSLQSLMATYGFDGFDIDIEHGLIPAGTFSQPKGDIAVLADIINTMFTQNPALLITMAPQVANISATSGFDTTWGNYASLIMQTHQSLAWVGIQLYNTGCAYGLDQVCYSQTETQSPNFSVAMAADLLEDWPEKLANGRSTGFQPYISHLNPSQVVLGYPAPNDRQASDGRAVVPTETIIRAIECLNTAVASASSCDTYIPPKAYGSIGGVFNWEVTYDQDNQFKFATDLKSCVINGVCH